MRKKVVVGNWKMNNNLEESIRLAQELKELSKNLNSLVQIKVAPCFVNLFSILNELKGTKIEVISQNCHQKEKGAFTGEISADMIKSLGVNTTILGHSERRDYFFETEEILKEKVDISLKNDLNIIFCIGEKLEHRKSNTYLDVIKNQLENSLLHINESDWEKIILAYEPVWAIGTGETASSQQIQEIHAFIRNLLKENYNENLAENVSILYGGSCKPENAKEIFSQKDVDGGLIGAASLLAREFISIVNSF